MDSLLEEGNWQQIRALRKPRKLKCGRLKNSSGQLVESDQWADTMADYLEHVQWYVRPAGLVDGPALGADLPVNVTSFSDMEVKAAVDKLKKEKASGPDDVPAEFWQAVVSTCDGLAWLTRLCNQCWLEEKIPEDWHAANVTAIHKKGSVEECNNYRPISLICVTYKLFATLFLKRLKEAGAEQRLTSTQFGFRSGRGTGDAVFAVRRRIDAALAMRDGRIGMVALDWRKAFDAISVEALLVSLKRFGLPPKLLRMIQHIYADRRFRVVDTSSKSCERPQRSGISQGCPLSPFLFVMLMSVIIEDSISSLSTDSRAHFKRGSLDVLLYADDTLVVGVEQSHIQELLNAIAEVGGRYGMGLHWSKFQMVQVNGKYTLRTPEGEAIPAKELMSYLGVNIYADGGIKNELNQKLGIAWADFNKLSRLWKRTSLPTHKKIRFLQAVVISRLLYGLSSAWLNVAEVRRLNGFYCRCLRVILKVPPPYISRVSNVSVLRQAGQLPISRQLLQQQMLLYGRIARSEADDVLRKITFSPGTMQPATSAQVRRVGRPRNEWTVMLRRESLKIGPNVDDIIRHPAVWRDAVAAHCQQ